MANNVVIANELLVPENVSSTSIISNDTFEAQLLRLLFIRYFKINENTSQIILEQIFYFKLT